MATIDGDAGWSAWQRHERELLRASLRATPAQRLAWLEEMMQLAQRFRRYTPQDMDENLRQAASGSCILAIRKEPFVKNDRD